MDWAKWVEENPERVRGSETLAKSLGVSTVIKTFIVRSGYEEASKTGYIKILITPSPAVRMVRGDTSLAEKPDFKIPASKLPRIKRVRRYMEFKAKIKSLWPDGVEYPTSGYHMIFNLPIPESRRKGKNKAIAGTKHEQKPDRDNLEKAVLDALYKDDSHVWDGRTTKLWADTGSIEIYFDVLPDIQQPNRRTTMKDDKRHDLQDDTNTVLKFDDEPKCVDLGGDDVYALLKNEYIDLMFDINGEILTRNEKADVLNRYIRYLLSKGKKLAVDITEETSS